MPPTAKQFLHAIEDDSKALCAAAQRGLDVSVPSCPGWTVRDVVIHTGNLHRQKVTVLKEGLTDSDFNRAEPVGDLLDWFSEGYGLLLNALRSVDPAIGMWSWYQPDQTAGFWYRRMAHETLIHRVDAELAHGAVTNVDPVLAEDGIDEALVVFISGYPAWATPEPGTATIRLSTPTRHWSLRAATFSGTTRSGRVISNMPAVILEPDVDKWDCEISGLSAALDLWLWGRGPLSDLEVIGNPEHAEMLRKIAANSA